MTGELVPREDIPGAISLNIIAFHSARTIAPAVGGIIVALAGPEGAFAVNLVTYIGLLAVLATWRRSPEDRSLPRETINGAMASGLRYVGNSSGVGRVIIRAALFGLCNAALIALLPLIARDLLSGTPQTFGILLGCAGAGAVFGAFMLSSLRARLSVEAIVRFAHIVTLAAILLVSFSTTVFLTGVGQLLVGFGTVLAMASFNVTMQISVPRWVVGRAISIFQMGSFGGLALGAWLWGAVAEVTGIAVALRIASLVLAGAMLLGLRFPLMVLEPELLEPARPRVRGDPPIGEEDATAPVSVLIEYRIDPENREQFLALMRERRQIRRREGARRWSLSQDANDHDLWLERYLRSSWTDFLRHRDRRTFEEERNLNRISAIHRGPEPPVIRFFVERDAARSTAEWTGSPLE